MLTLKQILGITNEYAGKCTEDGRYLSNMIMLLPYYCEKRQDKGRWYLCK